MFKNIKWVRLTPDRPGRGGTKTGIHSFQQQPINDTASITGCHVYRGAWRRDFDSVADFAAGQFEINSQGPLALHGYVYPSLTDPAALPGLTVFSHHNVGGVNHVWDQTVGVLRSNRLNSTTQAGVFQNVNGRCLFGDGAGEAMIFDDRTPAIHLQKNQKLGITTPTQPLQLVGGTSVVPDGVCYSHSNSAYLSHPDPDHPLGSIKAGETVTPSILDPNRAAIYSGALMAGANVLFDAETSNTTNFPATGTISITTGTSVVTLSGAAWPAFNAYAGMAINFNGYSFVIANHGAVATFTIDGTAVPAPGATSLYILGVYDGPTLTGVSYTITGCRVLMTAQSTLETVNTNSAQPPPAGAFGYSQSTNSTIVMVKINVLRTVGLYRNMGRISLGPVGGGTRKATNTAFMVAGSTGIYFAPGGVGNVPFVSSDVGSTIVVDLAGPGGTMLISTISVVDTITGGWLASSNQSGGNVGPVLAMWGTDFTGCTDAAITVGTPDLTAPSNPFTLDDVGKTIMVAGAGVAGEALYTTISAFVSTGAVTLAANAGATVAGVQAEWGAGTANTHVGPTYGYAWYDPETGHMSNISPLTQIPKPTTQGFYADFANLTPVFQIDYGFLSYPDQATDGIRFSHIMFFRTLSTPGSSTLYPIGSLNPFVGKVHPGGASTRGSWNPALHRGWMGLPNSYVNAPPIAPNSGPINLWYDVSSDSDLLLSGGFRAPQYTNEKPMVLLRGGAVEPGKPYALQYWDRRTWVVNTQEPTKIAFSCDEAQCPLGVPEESFPATNYLRLPAADGRVIALKTFGDLLLVTTQRWSYIIAGNNESNYRLMKISASMPGVGYYQMDEMPTVTGAEGEPSTLFYLGQDRVVYRWTMGGQPIPISLAIQNILDIGLSQGAASLAFYRGSRVHCISAWGRRLVVVQIFAGAGASFLIYDVDNQEWGISYPTDGTGVHRSFGGTIPMTTVYGMGVPINELYSVFTSVITAVIVRSWIRDDVSVCTPPMTIGTFPLSFDGAKTRKQIVSVNLHATATSGTYQLASTVNEDINQSRTATFTAYPDPLDSIYGANPAPYDGSSARDLVVMTAQFANDGTPLVGYRFTFNISIFNSTDTAKVYAIDIGYVEAEEPGDGSG